MPQSPLADALTAEEDARVRAMTVEERIELALRLGEESVRLYMQLHGVSRAEANRQLDRIGRIGRRPCSWER